MMMYNQIQTTNKTKANLNMTESTHAHSNSDAAGGHHSLAQKRLKSQQNYITNMSTQAGINALATGSSGVN